MTQHIPTSNHKKNARQAKNLPGRSLPILVAVGLFISLAVYLFMSFAEPGIATAAPTIKSSSTGSLSPVFTPSVRHWEPQILTWAAQNGLDPNLVATVMQIESCGNPYAESFAGAMGLFQVMPFHFYESDDPYDPDTNAARGMAYLAESLAAAGGDPAYALAGYNGGIGVISDQQANWADETLRYMYWGSGIYAEATTGQSDSPRLQEWYSAGGASLCANAQQVLGISE